MNGPSEFTRLRLSIHGAVQGVGFRPFVFRLATELGLAGWVSNSAQGVSLEVEGTEAQAREFLLRLRREKPPRSSIHGLEHAWLEPVGLETFQIRQSAAGGDKSAIVLPDIATCPDCLREILDPADRRYFYPFTNCTNCGPRFSIISALPYDRVNTSMSGFEMCRQCRAEYDDPTNRRFHAQPNACPVCGPHLELWDAAGGVKQSGRVAAEPALRAAARIIGAGGILALKGIGGFQLLVAAGDDAAVGRLRQRKQREEKPFAVLFPSLAEVRRVCEVSALEEGLLQSPESPIVLLRKKRGDGAGIAPAVAPGNPNLGVMLPYSPLHHLLLSLVGSPVVATSGNLSDEPICIDEREAVERLGCIADAFLVHNRPIVRHVDDSVARVLAGRELVLRRARGYAPLPVTARLPVGATPVLGVGAHLKNTVALSKGARVFISQHIGDLETAQAYDAFCRVVADLEKLYEAAPATVVADAHPDYLSSRFAAQEVQRASTGTSLQTVQHHVAHVFSCMAENELDAPVLGVAWDGTGYGLDGTVWGGEFFAIQPRGWKRFAHLRQFPLPGGDLAIKQPSRTALGLLYAAFGEDCLERLPSTVRAAFANRELSALMTMLRRAVNTPRTSSAGRLFDAVSALCGIRQSVAYEGQAAMELEFTLSSPISNEAYPWRLSPQSDGPHLLDWEPLLEGVLTDLKNATPLAMISEKFHNGLVEAMVATAKLAGLERVALSGGCFQNAYLTERAVQRLREEGFKPYWHQRVPPNDGGISLGQVYAALMGVTETQR